MEVRHPQATPSCKATLRIEHDVQDWMELHPVRCDPALVMDVVNHSHSSHPDTDMAALSLSRDIESRMKLRSRFLNPREKRASSADTIG